MPRRVGAVPWYNGRAPSIGQASGLETFGKYRLTERIAFGGMAEVFLATVHGEAGFSKPVVIKRLHPRLNEDAEFVNMLIDEARITAQLAHGNICQVLDLGSVDSSYYMAMEYIAGEDLRTVHDNFIRNGMHLPVEASLYILAEVLAGLHYAHNREGPDGQPLHIIHRDVSPHNVLISYEGEVKIIDFGIAKARMRMVQTQAGVIKGKFRYMSPEQASGQEIDHRTDIFAAGVVLYELLRGGPHLVDIPDTEVLRIMREAAFDPLNTLRPELPAALCALVHRALARRARNRFPSATAFREALIDFMRAQRSSFGRSELAGLMQDRFATKRRGSRSGAGAGAQPGRNRMQPGSPSAEPLRGQSAERTSLMEQDGREPALAPARLVAKKQSHGAPAAAARPAQVDQRGMWDGIDSDGGAPRIRPEPTALLDDEDDDSPLLESVPQLSAQRLRQAPTELLDDDDDPPPPSRRGATAPPAAVLEQAPTALLDSQRANPGGAGVSAALSQLLTQPDEGEQTRQRAAALPAAPAAGRAGLDAPVTETDGEPTVARHRVEGIDQAPTGEQTRMYNALDEGDIEPDEDAAAAVPQRRAKRVGGRALRWSARNAHRSTATAQGDPTWDDRAQPAPHDPAAAGHQVADGAQVVAAQRARRAQHRRAALRRWLGLLVMGFIFAAIAAGGALLAFKMGLLAPSSGTGGTAEQQPGLQAVANDSATEARAQLGRVHVSSRPPGARIRLCSRAMSQRTPAVVEGPAGERCLLELSLKGYALYRLPVTLHQGRALKVRATLRRRHTRAPAKVEQPPRPASPIQGERPRTEGQLLVTSVQVGTVYVNGRPMGKTPRLLLDLQPGSYGVRMRFPALGVDSRSVQITIRAGQRRSLHFDSTP